MDISNIPAEQRAALDKLYHRIETDRPTWEDFLKTVQPGFDGSGCLMVPLWNMWIGIEKDGYTHS